MGIPGLLPLLKSIMEPTHIKEFSGQYVAVDTYSWLHKGALACSMELCKGLKSCRHIDYCMHRVNLLKHNGVKPILVFDGGLLPMKAEQESKRLKARRENLERAIQHEFSGNSAAAYECYQKAVDISPSVAVELIQVLRHENVDYIVAPYEADAQMAFFSITKRVEAVITEDSDLIPFGCSKIIFKMDKFGHGVQFCYDKLQQNKEFFTGFTRQMLLDMCILSGCDYLQSLPGVGPKRAHALVQKFKSHEKIIKHLRFSGVSIPPIYEEAFKKAIWTFRHQRVYDPVTEDIVHLSEPPTDLGSDLEFLGPILPQNIVKGIAGGNLDPFTKMPFQEEIRPADEIYLAFQHRSKKQMDLPVQKNVMTNYFCLASVEAKREFRAPPPRITFEQPEPLKESSQASDGSVSNSSILVKSPSFNNILVEQHLVGYESCESGRDSNALFTSNVRDIGARRAKMLDLTSKGKRKDPTDTTVSNNEESNVLVRQLVTSNCSQLTNFGEKSVDSCGPDEFTVKERSLKKKVIIRSSYFPCKLLDGNGHDDIKTDADDYAKDMAESTAANRICEGMARSTFRQTVSSVHTANDQILHCSNKLVDKVSCSRSLPGNISHLDEYSYIAEKSMERFVSLTSSFKRKASGSRASGLRPPLKDLNSACNITLSKDQPADLSKFVYIPQKQKTIGVVQQNGAI